MKVFAQNVAVAGNCSAKVWEGAYARLAMQNVADTSYGICYNASQLSGTYADTLCGYVMTERLFACIIGHESIYPIMGRPAHSWEMRRKWCAAFAASFETGEIEVDDEMEKSLNFPIDVSLIIRHDAYID